MRNIWSRRQLDLETTLRASRPRARAEFVETLAHEIRTTPAERSRAGRIGLAFALSGLILVLLASFGGIGYAYSAAKHAVKKPTVAKVQRTAKSAAEAQYAPFVPPKKPAREPAAQVKKVTAKPKPVQAAQPATTSDLPFTGLALWVPVAIGLLLIAIGLTTRLRGHRRTSA